MTLTPDQLAARKRGVGSSEVLAAIGKDPRCSRLELYARKIGQLPDDDLSDVERVRWGNLLEDVIRDELGRRIGHKIIKPKQTVFHPVVPLVGHLDGWIPALGKGVEVKTADKYEAAEFGEQESDQVPIRYLVQCAGYMAITNTDEWLLGVLIGGNDLRTYRIPRDREIEAAVLAGVAEFWSRVETRTPPHPETPAEVSLRWPKDHGGHIVATTQIEAACSELAEARKELRQAEMRCEQLKYEIQCFMGDTPDLMPEHGIKPLATWRSAKPSMRFDVDRFAKEHKRLFAKYQREVPGSRPFLLKVRS